MPAFREDMPPFANFPQPHTHYLNSTPTYEQRHSFWLMQLLHKEKQNMHLFWTDIQHIVEGTMCPAKCRIRSYSCNNFIRGCRDQINLYPTAWITAKHLQPSPAHIFATDMKHKYVWTTFVYFIHNIICENTALTLYAESLLLTYTSQIVLFLHDKYKKAEGCQELHYSTNHIASFPPAIYHIILIFSGPRSKPQHTAAVSLEEIMICTRFCITWSAKFHTSCLWCIVKLGKPAPVCFLNLG